MPTEDEIVAGWEGFADDGASARPGGGQPGFARPRSSTTPGAASWWDKLNPRNIIRGLTVWHIKDRAGTVGANGVADLLIDMLEASTPDANTPENARATARLHLIGHSYGCKVMLSAICAKELPRPVTSLLLLQPAVSYLCFAEDVGGGKPGGYRAALTRVTQPILTTFSRHDRPLTKLFHKAVRRGSDVGDLRIAGSPPNKYAALGGFGPGGCDDVCVEIPIKTLPERYELDPQGTGVRIYALNGDEHISGHGDISNPATWWTLYNQVAQVAGGRA
jgi:hypothetical protein